MKKKPCILYRGNGTGALREKPHPTKAPAYKSVKPFVRRETGLRVPLNVVPWKQLPRECHFSQGIRKALQLW